MKKTKNMLSYLLTVFLSALILFLAWIYVKDDAHLFQQSDSSMEEVLAQVISITDEDQTISSLGNMYYVENIIEFDARVLRGPRKGEILQAQQLIDNVSTMGTVPVEAGDKLFLYSGEEDGQNIWNAGDYYRSGQMAMLLAFFCLAVLLFGRKKGFNTLLSLGFTCIAVFAVFVPSILGGHNPYLFSGLTCLYVITMTLALVSGCSRKSLASALGCAGGVLAAGLITVFMSSMMKLSGFVDDDSLYVYFMNEEPINLLSIIFASNIIGALGASMDVAMSLSSSLHELAEQVPNISFRELYRSGIHIGQDIMGTMANTLVLAYIGSSLSTMLLFISYQASLMQLLNRELIVVELLQALSGSIGILLTIPISAAAAALLYRRKID